MDAKNRHRLFGLNHFLSDLLNEDTVISHILNESGFDKEQIADIRDNRINEYVTLLTGKLLDAISKVLSKEYAEIIEFWYYLDGRKPDVEQNAESYFKIPRQYLAQIHSEALCNLRKPSRIELLKKNFISAADVVLKDNNEKLFVNIKSKYRKMLIKESAERINARKTKVQKLIKKKKTKKRKLLEEQLNCEAKRVAVSHEPTRRMFNPWLGPDRYTSNWW